MTAPTTSPPAITAIGAREGEPAGSRRSVRVLLVVGGVGLVLAALLLLVTRPGSSTERFHPENAEPDGARATAQVLGQQGVDVTVVTTTDGALAEAEAATTLLVVGPDALDDAQRAAIADVPADVVLVDVGTALDGLTERLEVSGQIGTAAVDARCDDADAEAAGTLVAGGATLDGDDVTTCFDGLYATWQDDGRTWRVLTDARPLTNESLALEGNAALVLRSLGAHERVVWYLPAPGDTFGEESPLPTFPLPTAVVVQLLLVGVALVLWRGRRLGAVVVEPLPVVVRATETTRGRGRLYRRARAHAHAAGALRAGLVARLAGRVGLPAHAPPEQVVDVLARSSGRSHDAVRDVLYGPAPTTDDGLQALTQALDTLESEVLRG